MKRLFDVLVSGGLLLLTAPLAGAIALLILVRMGRPVLFRQERPGKGGRIFTLLKFRTMEVPRSPQGEEPGDEAQDADRLTPLGRILRRSSLDEIPQLWNVLRGEMSLVGPRPLLVQYLPLYTPEQARRHEVRPGITGWAQVQGRNDLTWEEKFRLDVRYVDNRSFLLDLWILLRTLKEVVIGSGVSQEGKATVEYFRGSDRSAPSGAGERR